MVINLSKFTRQRYVCLETFKRNGEGVRTPIWFVEENNAFYIWTMVKSGKVKRIRNNSRVRIVPSSITGRPKGAWVDAEARVATDSQAAHATELIKMKYGIQFWLASHLNKAERIVIEIREIT